MKKHFFLFLALFMSGAVWAQTTQSVLSCTRPSGQLPFQGNQVRYTLKVGDAVPFGAGSQALYRPDTAFANVATLYAANLWLGSTDDAGFGYIAANTYGSGSATGSDFYAGPIDTSQYAVCAGYDKIWSVRRYMLLALLDDFNDNGVINNPIHPDIMGFPCRNNPHFSAYNNGTVLLSDHDFAAFKDRNNDGIYDPLQGDYPIIPETDGTVLPEQLAWFVFNDEGNNGYHAQTGGINIMRAEIQATVYAFSCPDPMLDRTTFLSYKIINQSRFAQTMTAGIWSDPDLGCPTDDYIGCIPSMNTAFVYNSDVYDDINCSIGGSAIAGFGTVIPAQAITFLNKTMGSAGYYMNGGGPKNGDPFGADQYLNYLNGFWRDGSPYYPCGDGSLPCDIDSTITKFVFPGNANNGVGWSMKFPITSMSLPNADYITISATQPQRLLPTESMTVTLAFSYHSETGAEHWQNIYKMYQNLPLLQQFYNNGYTGGCVQPTTYCTGDCVFAGDTNKDGEVSSLDILYMGCAWNNTGAQRTDRSGIFQPSVASNWTQTPLANNLNRKHQDANGDGKVSYSDLKTINANFGLRNMNYTGTNYTPAGNALVLESNTPLLTDLDSIPQNFTAANIPVKVRLKGNNNQVQNFYGVSFTLTVPDTLFYISQNPNILLNNLIMVDTSVYLVNMKFKKGVGTQVFNPQKSIDVVIVRRDGQNFNGSGIDLLSLKIRRNNVVYNQTVGCARFSNVRMIKNDGTTLPYGAQEQCMVFTTSTTVLATEGTTVLQFEAYPNPTENEITLVKPTDNRAMMTATDLAGRTVFTQQLTQNTTTIPTHDWQNGVYFITIVENGSRAVQKIVVLH
jgi:Secretion system C-terminal sorting domain/Dockerin type I domain